MEVESLNYPSTFFDFHFTAVWERTRSFALIFGFLGIPCLTTFREANKS